MYGLCTGFGVLRPQNVGWLFNGGVDPSIHFVGWHMFRFGPWQWPIGSTYNLGHPVGTSVGLTDSIPLLAILVKPFSGALPDVVQYFGLWLLLCFVLQGVFGAALVARVTKHSSLRFLGGSIFAVSPLLVHRMGHAALTAHWTLLAALWLTFDDQSRSPFRRLAAWTALGIISAGIHPYLAVMVGALAFGALLSEVSSPRSSLARLLMPLLLIGGAIVGTWWVSGYFIVPNSADLQNTGFGLLSMNLFSPFIPFDESLFGGRVPYGLARYDQHEGFSYLGLGGIALVIAGMACALGGPWRKPTRRSVCLLAVCIGLTAFALSPTITLGQRVLLEYPASWWGPLSTFRASGRMFWPVYYVILFASITIVVRRLDPRLSALAMGLVLCLQIVDLHAVYRSKHTGFTMPFTNPYSSPFWPSAFRHFAHVVLLPSNMCAPMEQSLDYRFFALYAGPAGATLNGGFAARYDAQAVAEYCRSFAAEIALGTVRDDSIYVLAPGLQATFLRSQNPTRCVPVDGLFACFSRASSQAWFIDSSD